MTTTYDGTTRFRERLRATPLIVLARVADIADVLVERFDDDRAQVQTVFRLEVEEGIKGQAPGRVLVRVVGGSSDGVETPWSARLEVGDTTLLLLAPDIGPERSDDAFVPYFRSAYRLEGDRVLLDAEAAEDLAAEGLPVEDGSAPFVDVRALIADVVRQQDEEDALLAQMEPEEVRRQPPLDIIEMPSGDEALALPKASATTVRGARSDTPAGRRSGRPSRQRTAVRVRS